MPCVDSYADNSRVETVYQTDPVLVARLNQTTHLLCTLCRSAENMGADFSKMPELDLWWRQHKEEDAERENRRLLELARVKDDS